MLQINQMKQVNIRQQTGRCKAACVYASVVMLQVDGGVQGMSSKKGGAKQPACTLHPPCCRWMGANEACLAKKAVQSSLRVFLSFHAAHQMCRASEAHSANWAVHSSLRVTFHCHAANQHGKQADASQALELSICRPSTPSSTSPLQKHASAPVHVQQQLLQLPSPLQDALQLGFYRWADVRAAV